MDAVEPRIAIEVVTLFASEVRAALAMGVVGRALERGLARVGTEDPRALTTDVHGTVDDRSYGGGPGMVLKVEPLAGAIERAAARLPAGSPTILLSAQGRRFDQAAARRLAALPAFVLVAGRYEGVDERLVEELVDEELSIGDYVLSGGELAALVVVDAVVRLLPGALGAAESAEQESFGESPGPLLDWPHYTRPEEWRGRRVPEVLRSGNHAAIRRWRLKEALGRTAERRPDLLAGRKLSNEEQRLLDEYRKEHEP